MALPPIILTRQAVRLVSPVDTAIDYEKSDPAAITAYIGCEDLDVENIQYDRAAATVFQVRALSPAEFDVTRALAFGVGENDDDSDEVTAVRSVEFLLHAVRFGLVAVENLDGWDKATRTRVNGSHLRAWTVDAIEALDGQTRLFLGRAIVSLSVLEKKSGVLSSSLPDKANGTTPGETTKGASGQSLSTADGAN